ncbi:MAG TPA: transketolase [Candidatus Pullichristensenella excrementigallinarum]|uniref:Transketolase n=1 Tax=Candidatus Pullichristensenella excrementigallinarum TaxID=2840907 RepID=A0A9D1I998_9FIRM|nr:transketolase [Candidatus Pullichristensenella excrementigallinarum]
MNNEKMVVNAIRILSAEAVQKAKSGHPGMPMGAAAMAYAVWGREMKHNPKNPKFVDRDRFVLSSGHGSMLLYSLLHLFGYGLTIEDLKQFRQYGSKTPGHPEYKHTVGVETTTGPLGQGIANAVGMAMAEKHLAAKFNREGFPVVDHNTYCILGDGCMMEGISHEACSLAGTLKLNKLIALYDDNEISIEGSTDIAFREDVPARFRAYGWNVIDVANGNCFAQVDAAIKLAKQSDKPNLIVCHTAIGYGSPKAGQASAHGEPLGEENVALTKKALGWPEGEAFFVPDCVYEETAKAAQRGQEAEDRWNNLMAEYAKAYPELKKEWDIWFSEELPVDLINDEAFWAFDGKAATRNSSGVVLNRLAERIPNLFGGSADLAPSNKSNMKGKGDFSDATPEGDNIHFGVREHAMAAICNGIKLHGGLRPYCATFFVFSDYMKNAMRMSSIMDLSIPYILTHDSIGVGEDGPTHQPIEHLAGLRAIPGLTVFRPADSKEVAAGWITAMTGGRPVALVLTRQDLPLYENSGKDALKGGYILSDCEGTPDVLLMASGSEVEQCMGAQELLKAEGIKARVISMPSFELFEAQSDAYKESVMPSAVRARVAIEAAATFGWHKYVGLDGQVIGLDHFGASAPYKLLFQEYGFTAENVAATAKKVLG